MHYVPTACHRTQQNNNRTHGDRRFAWLVTLTTIFYRRIFVYFNKRASAVDYFKRASLCHVKFPASCVSTFFCVSSLRNEKFSYFVLYPVYYTSTSTCFLTSILIGLNKRLCDVTASCCQGTLLEAPCTLFMESLDANHIQLRLTNHTIYVLILQFSINGILLE